MRDYLLEEQMFGNAPTPGEDRASRR